MTDPPTNDATVELPPEVKLCIISWTPGITESKSRFAQVEEFNSYNLDYLKLLPATNSDVTCRSLSGTNHSWRAVANDYIYETINLYWVETRAGITPLLDQLRSFYELIALPHGRLVKHLVLPLFHHDDNYLHILEEKLLLLSKIVECFVNLKRLHVVLSPLPHEALPRPKLLWQPCLDVLRRFNSLDYFGIASAYMYPIRSGCETLNCLVEAGVFNARHLQMSLLMLDETAGGLFETTFLPNLMSTRKLNIVVPSGLKTGTLRLPPNSISVRLTYRQLLCENKFAKICRASLQNIQNLQIIYRAAYSELSFADLINWSSSNIDWMNLADLTLEGIIAFKPLSRVFSNAPKLRRLTFFATRTRMLDIRDLTGALEDNKGFSAPVALITIHDRAERSETVLVSRKLYEESGELEFESVCARRKIVMRRVCGTEAVRVVKVPPARPVK